MSFKKMLVSAAAAAAMTTSVFAAGNNGDATPIDPDGTGDYLVFPTYWAKATGNWATNLKVVNTNTTHAIVAKVVVREYATSQEDLDFFIYLTPGDVWEGKLYSDGGFAKLYSDDDSIFKGDVPASTTNPVDQILFDNGPKGNEYGYVEVYGVAQIPANLVTILPGHTAWAGAGTPLDKQSLYQDYTTNVHGQGANAGAAHGWMAVDNNSIFGQQVISSDAQGSEKSMTMMATAFTNVTGPVSNGIVIKAAATNITNATTRTDYIPLIQAVESELEKTNVYVTYYNSDTANTVLQLTQPMKKYHLENLATPVPYWFYDAGQDTGTPTTQASALLNPDRYLAFGFEYGVTTRDQEENSHVSTNDFSGGAQVHYKCYTEICYFTPLASHNPGGYDKGYFDYDLTGTYANGEAVIPTIMTAVKINGTPITNIIYAPYSK